MNYTYIVQCRDNSFYTGWTNDIEKRMKAHNDGTGAKYTKARRPVTLVYYEEFESKIDAQRREYRIKRLTRKEKEQLISDAEKEGILGARMKKGERFLKNLEGINHIFFDLDGTLLPMDQDTFVNYYFPMLAKRMMKFGVEPKETVKAVWAGVKAMTTHDGTESNETVFWRCFEDLLGIRREDVEDEILAFYGNEFNQAIAATEPSEISDKVIKELKEQGKKVYLTTNPIFPKVATMNRIRWAGMDADDFEWITVYENSYSSKPNLKYYQNVLDQFGLDPKECLMVGNDVLEDLSIRDLGVKTYLVTDCLENKKNLPVETEFQGSLGDLYQWIQE